MSITIDGSANTIAGLAVGGIGAVVNSSNIVDASVATADLAQPLTLGTDTFDAGSINILYE